jgi:diguanylate cyclase (GGDEF)-like protein/PAS domain S-box-containing protein
VEARTELRSGRTLDLPSQFDAGTLGRGVLRLFAHSTRTALALLDPEGRLLWANPAFDGLGLCANDAWLGRPLLEVLVHGAPADEPDDTALLRMALQQQAATHTLFSVRTPDGRRLWLEADLQPLREREAATVGFALVLHDVSARVRERRRLRRLIDSTIAGIVVQDAAGRIVDCNVEAERLLGRSRAQLLSTSSEGGDWDAVHEDGSPYPGAEHPGMRVLRDGAPVRGDVMGIRLPTGERRWIEVNTELMTDHDSGERSVVNSFINLTAQKAVQAQMHAERERLLASLESTRAGVWEWQLDTGALQIDARWAEILGETLDSLQPLSIQTFLDRAHPDDLARSQRLSEAHFEGSSPHYECELRLRHREGHWVWVLARGRVALRDAVGQPQRVYGTHTEISQRKRTEDELARTQVLLRGLFERSPLGVALNDLVDGRFLDGNAALLRMLGYRREQLLASSYWEITPRDYAEAEAEQLRCLMQTGAYGPYEKEYVDASGRRLPVLLSGIRITQPDGSEHIWSVVQDLSERRQFEQQLQRAALTDELTGLPNRALLLQRLLQVLREVRTGGLPGAALLFVDFDRFKQINDRHGHDAGDELLRKAAMRMRAALRADDVGLQGPHGNVVARFGGDEFVMLLADVHDEASACHVARRLIETVAPPYRLGGVDIELGVSVGVVLLDPAADSADEILRRADQAMYRAKNAGGGRVEVCRR